MRSGLVQACEQVFESRAAHAAAIAAASARRLDSQGPPRGPNPVCSRLMCLRARAELVRHVRASCDAQLCMLLVSRLVMCVHLAV